MVQKLIIGLVGMPASGKSTVANYIAKKYHAHTLYSAEFIWNFLEKRGIRKTEEMGAMAGLYLWANYQDIPLIDWVVSQIKKIKSKIILIDSIRTTDELNYFTQKYKSKFHMIAIITSPAVRLERERKRARLGKVTIEEFKLRDKTELTTGQGDVMALADHYVVGNISRKGVEAQVAVIMRQIQKA